MTLSFMDFLSVIVVPIVSAMAWYILRLQNKVDAVNDSLKDLRVHVAEKYATNLYIKEVEDRITAHLIRIERKLDAQGDD